MQHNEQERLRRRCPWTTVALAAAVLLSVAGAAGAQSVTRGPYLQSGTDTGVVVRWRTNQSTDSRVRYGDDPANLIFFTDDNTSTSEHEVTLSGLAPDTLYYYSVGTTSGPLAGDASYYFLTSPIPGTSKPTRIWVIGDSGTADANAAAVRDAYLGHTGSTHTDLWVMLGDNAYNDGTDTQYQNAVFNMYPTLLRQSVLWPTLGNHDGYTADSATQSGPYYDIFALPKAAEAGGVASGTEAYYAFDYANIHFIVLESYETDRSTGGAMLTWLVDDLMQVTADWTVAIWHHPPYTKGSHNSDNESQLVDMRQNALPILEDYGVDLVLSGHSHSYERSMLIDGHYGTSNTFDLGTHAVDSGSGNPDTDGYYDKPTLGPAPHEGAVYAVAGSSGKISGGQLNHPAMYISLNELGSMVLDFDGGALQAVFLDGTGQVSDELAIVKGGGNAVCGNGVREFGEDCDGADLGGATCGDFACSGGSLSCAGDCTYDTASCTGCPVCDDDGVCEVDEDCNSCPGDCPSSSGAACGNGICEAGNGEDCVSCAADCNGRQSGKPANRFCCGDGDGAGPVPCADAACSSGGWQCTDVFTAPSCCGDGACTGVEDSFICELDCGPPPTCGDGSCDPGEDPCSCAGDCGSPPLSETSCSDGQDEDCDGNVDCADVDCDADPACDGSCQPVGASCSIADDCCSLKCKGPAGRKTCK